MKRLLEQMTVAVSALAAAAGNMTSHKNVPKVWTTTIELILLATIGPLAAPAIATSSPQITITCTGANGCTVTGAGFTPSGRVLAQAYAGSSNFSSTYLVASAPTLVCTTGGLKPVCREVGGGSFTTALPVDYELACDATAAGALKYTDVSSGAAASDSITWTGPCTGATTTTLTLPSTVDTGWAPSVNPARVTAGSTLVTSGTITIDVNGSFFCQYSAGANSGCTSAHLPAGTDQIEASYSGSTIPPYDPSSASATVTVVQVDPSGNTTASGWAGYVDTGDTFTSVSASWTVPKANCGFLETSTSAAWVGIDGWNETTVEQIGTDSNCILGQGEYWAWWEMFPGSAQVIGTPTLSGNYAVYPGDLMKASVTSTGTHGQYKLSIEDQTQAWTYVTTQSYPNANGFTAECIVEQPPANGLPLTNFGTVTFNQCNDTGSSGVASPIWDHTNLAVNMTNGSILQAATSTLSDDGSTFTVTWIHN